MNRIAKVIESNGNTIIVEPNEDEEIRKSSDKIAIGLGEHNDALYMVGTGVKVTYDGIIMETYPAQINATKIEIKLADNFEIFFNEKQPIDSYKIYTILEKNKADNYNYTIYGYDGIVNIKIDDKDYSLKDALLQNKITMNEIIAKANQDEKTELGLWYEINKQLLDEVGLAWRGKEGWSWDWHIIPGFSMAYTRKERELLIDTAMNKFKEIYGFLEPVDEKLLLSFAERKK